MVYLIAVSFSVGVFSIILALVSIWLSVTYSRDAQKMLNETREVVKSVDRKVEDIEKYTRDQVDKMLTHIMELSKKEVAGTDVTKVVEMMQQIQGTPLEGVLMKHLEKNLERKQEK